MIQLPKGQWPVILADPPWKFITYSAKGRDRCPETRHYETMTFDDIKAMPVRDVAAKDCVLFLWSTDPMLERAFELANAWGFKYSTVAFYWTKTKKSGAEHIGGGYWTRKNPEQCLLFKRGHPHRINKDVRAWIHAPVREHSRKPDEAYERIERLVAGPYLELWSRTSWNEQWTVWGDQSGIFNASTTDITLIGGKP